ncbi:amidase [Enterococcus crotali]
MNIHKLTIEQAKNLLSKKSISPEELVHEFYKHITIVEPQILAWETLKSEMSVIKQINISKESNNLSPLSFIPYGVKDIFLTKNIRTEAGSKTLKGFIPDQNATVIEKLNKSSALLLGKTTTTEFASGGGAPQTRNPWNLSHTPGGSSTGSAAALASGMVLFSLGTQTSGSVMRPASYNGLSALKPTFGTISKYGILPASPSIDCVGIFTKNVRDLTYVFNQIKGYDAKDCFSLNRIVSELNVNSSSSKKFKIGLIKDNYFEGSAEVMSNLENAIRVLEKQGHIILSCKMPKNFGEANRAHGLVVDSETAAYHQDRLEVNKELFSKELNDDIRVGMSYTAVEYVNAQLLRNDYKSSMRELFKEFDLLITPTTPETAPEGLEKTGSPKFNVPFSNAGLPTLTVPIGFSDKNLPIGMQIIADNFCEQHLIDIGEEFQRETDFHLKFSSVIIEVIS